MISQPKVVLLAEDEPLIRMIAVDLLAEDGFDVIEAGHAVEALAVLQQRATSIHVLFTDLHMPGLMDGLALAHHAYQHWPWIGLLMVSSRARPHHTLMPLGGRFMDKPYGIRHMLDHVRDLAG